MDLLLATTKNGLGLIILVLVVITAPGLLVGLIVALFQSITQVHEMSLTFVPKIIVTLASLLVLSGWYGNLILHFTKTLLLKIPGMVS